MHISEGILTAPVLLGGGALTVAGTMIGLKKIDYGGIMSVAMLTAVFFVASLVHVPLGPGSIHLLLHGLLGLILGWAAFPAILIALLLQALLFQYGGILVLGVNTCMLAGPAVLCGYAVRPLLQRNRVMVAGFLAGFFSVLLSGILMALALMLSDAGFLAAAKLVLLAHLPLMVLEGLITMFVVAYLKKVQPAILNFSK